MSSLFLVSVTAQTIPYDPWVDIDQDGEIDIFDVVPVAYAYGAEGDPTRNVTVTNWPIVPSKADYEILYLGRENCSGDTDFSFWGDCGGYSKVTLFAEPWLENPIKTTAIDYGFTISLHELLWKRQPNLEDWPHVGFSEDHVLPAWQLNLTSWSDDGFWCNGPTPAISFETKGPYFLISFYTNTTHPQPGNVWTVVDFYAYLRNG